MKYIKCLKIDPETVCSHLRENYQPFTISEVELNLNELAASLIESLLDRLNALETTSDSFKVNEADLNISKLKTSKPSVKPGRLLASYLIIT